MGRRSPKKALGRADCDVPEHERHRAFNTQPILNRILVLLAGPVFNFILAIAFFWLVFVLGVNEVKPVVGLVDFNTPAGEAGLLPDDQIVAVNGQDVSTWTAAHLALLDGVIRDDTLAVDVQNYQGGDTRSLTFQLPGNRKQLTEPSALLGGLGFTTWFPEQAAVIATVVAGGPAEIAGLQAGDEFLSIDTIEIASDRETMALLRDRAGKRINVDMLRNGEVFTAEVHLSSVPAGTRNIGRIGISFVTAADAMDAGREDMVAFTTYGALPALQKAGQETWRMSVMMVSMLGKMLVGQVSTKNISGPLNIARFAGMTAKQGPTYYIRFLALLSLSLGVLNLLPVPMLDGGQIVFQLAEGIKGKPLSMRTEVLAQQLGIFMLMILMFFAFRNDLIDIFG